MSSKYTFSESDLLHFVTMTVVDWIDLFTKVIYKDIIINSLKHCQTKKGLEIYGWVIMTNHLHMIISSSNNSLSSIMRDFKKHTSLEIKDAITHSNESRKKWMMERFVAAGTLNSNNDDFQLWQQNNHPLVLNNPEIAHQKLDYIHYNPVEAGFVLLPEDYLYSSAKDYYTTTKGLLDIVFMESQIR
jgi:REP element-mobilizing transposase RayT